MPEPSVLTHTPDGQPRPAAALLHGLRQPVRVDMPAPPITPPTRVVAVIPCYNRPDDARNLLNDLAGLVLPHIDLRVLLVDNASDQALSSMPSPAGVRLEHLRLETNTGGSGGFNAGIAHAMSLADPPEFIWLLDSDARVEPGALEPLVDAMASHPELRVAGSSLGDPVTGEVFELGGHVDRRSGLLVQPRPTAEALSRGVIPVEYVAACSMLVRASAIPDAGLMPEVFVNGDDVGWCLRLGRANAVGERGSQGERVAVVPRSRARHPHHDKMHTWGRYYIARNAFGPVDALGLGAAARFRRAMREVLRATLQQCMNRPDLAGLHMAGLRDARRGRTTGPAPAGTVRFEAFEPLSRLGERLKGLAGRRAQATIEPGFVLSPTIAGTLGEQLRSAGLAAPPPAPPGTPAGSLSAAFSAIGRLAISPLAPRNRIAVVSARGRPGSWFRGSTQVQIVNEGRGSFIVRPGAPIACAARALGTLVGGLVLSLRLAAAPVAPALVPPAPASRRRTPVDDGAAPFASPGPEAQSPAPGTLAIVVLSYNRYAALERTLNALGSFSSLKGAEVLVVDNGSTDGTPAKLAAEFPQVRLLALEKNIGVAAFNRAAEHCAADYLLILDDDAVPDEAALNSAIGLLGRRPGLGAVTLHPRHPATGQSEWRFAASVDPARGRDDWPVMGCANLVRRDAWTRAGGYAESFFLYRNDTDLALKILALGMGVHFNPAWVAWHDSPAAAKKSSRWHRLATRNWVWLARRHCGAGLRASASGVLGALFGWLWAHRLAGLSVPRHLATIQGLCEGLAKRPAPAPPTSGAPWRSLLRLRLGRSEK